MTASEQIAAFSVGFNPASLNSEITHQFARAYLDTFAVGVAGWNEPATKSALRYLGNLGMPRPGAMAASLWGPGAPQTVEAAALCNGIAAHVLDYDDVTSPLRGHPSVALLPALVALGEAMDASVLRVASAYVVGFEVMCKLARVIAVPQYEKGWHSTATIGGIGSAVACSHLLGLDVAGTVNAIGIAVAQAAGTRANFGSDAKSFQAGHANAAALRAALLAQTGFGASAQALDPELGYLALYGKGEDVSMALSSLGELPLELLRSGIEIKKYPLCYATHRALDGLLALRREENLSLQDVSNVEVKTSAGALEPLVHHRPRTGLQGKFSMEYAVAAALQDGQVTLESFTDAAVMRPEIQEFLPKVTSQQATATSIFPRWTQLRVHRRDGSVLMREVHDLEGSASHPLSDAALVAKATQCLRWGGNDADAAQLLRMASQSSTGSMRQLLALGRISQT